MKKYLKFCLTVLLGVLLIPMVHAAELPKTGVTYFMTYPNGEVEVTEDYNVAINPPEKLLYSLTTNSQGVIPLCDCMNEGTLRLVQHVPSGYTTNQKEITIDLANANSASFVDYRGGNPSTGRSILVFLGIAAVLGATIIVSRRNKKALVIVPAFLLVLVAYKVSAAGCINVSVKDGSGNPLEDVVVDVYGTPIVTAAPAIKLDANGGHFMNGKEVIYVPLPSAECTVEELWDSMTEEEENYYLDNIEGAYRDGYYPEELIYPDEPLRNGSVARMDWSEDSYAKLFKIDGNGGTFDFHGEKLEELVLYTEDYPFEYISNFVNGDYYYVGYDDNPACSNYTSGGSYIGETLAKRKADNYETILYLCWNAKPDGVYINDTLFRGSNDNCYEESNPTYGTDYVSLYNFYDYNYIHYTSFHMMDDENVEFVYRKATPTPISSTNQVMQSIVTEGIDGDISELDRITYLEIVNNGQVVVSLSENDLVEVEGVYHVGNSTKNAALTNYIKNNINACQDVGGQR